MRTSFIATVYNEQDNIESFLESVLSQSIKPDEIIIVDGGSTDKTLEILDKFKSKIKVFKKNGNRSVGRNYAISKSRNEVIAISDSGCVLDKSWLKNITSPFVKKDIEVVAGYYDSRSENTFQKCLSTYVLVMPDRININNFLPATRSMAIRKSAWKKLDRFPEEFSNNEDYVFAKRIKSKGIKIFFQKNAVAHWIPRKNLRESYNMFYRFALGDAESGIYRPKVLLIFVRYIIFLLFLIISLQSSFYLYLLIVLVASYILWAITKNYKYVQELSATVYLPILQLTSDLAVIHGTLVGITLKNM